MILAWLTRHRVATLLLVALAARALTFGNPIIHADEQFYFVVADAMWRGQLPYLDIWDRKPLGLFLLYMPAALLPPPWGTLAYQMLALVCVVATAALIARLAERAGWGRGTVAAGIAYVLWLNLLNGSSGQSPVFYNLPVALAASLTVTRPGWRRAGLVAMGFIGLALQIKSAAVFEGVFLGLWLLFDDWRARRDARGLVLYAVMLVALALLPTVAAWGFYAAKGAGGAWWQANVTAVLGRLSDPWPTQVRNGLKLLLVLSPLIAMGFGAIRGGGLAGDAAARAQVFLRAWFAVSLLGIVAFGGWYDHYGLPALVPGSACAAAFFAGAGRRHATPILLLAALVGQITLAVRRANGGDARQAAALARAVGSGAGALFIYSGEPILYAQVRRPFVTRYIFPSHLYLAREDGSIGVRQHDEVRRIVAHRPEVIVIGPPYRSEELPIRRVVNTTLQRDYKLAAQVRMGKRVFSVYRARSATPSSTETARRATTAP